MVSKVTKYIATAAALGGSAFIAQEYLSEGRKVKKTYSRPSDSFGAISNESPKSLVSEDLMNNLWNNGKHDEDQLYNGYVTKIKKWIPGSK